MPYRAMPWVKAGGVSLPTGEWVALESARWFEWLQEANAFCYSCAAHALRLTVRQEQRRQHRYWYAYSKIDAKLHNTYLGKSHRLTHPRLEAACEQIWQQHTEVHMT